MRKFDQNFSDFRMEKEFSHLIEQTHLKTVKATIIFWIIALVSFSLPQIYNNEGDRILGIIILSLNGILLLMLVFRNKAKNVNKYLVRVLTIVLGIGGMIILFFHEKERDKLVQFTRGWSFGSIQVVLMFQFFETKYKIIVGLISFVVRFAIMGSINTDVFTLDSIVGNLLFDTAIIYAFATLQSREKQIFQNGFWYKQEHFAMKALFNSCLPQSITILNRTATQVLFSNKASINLFSPEQQGEEFCESFMPPLELLKVEIEKRNEAGSIPVSSTSPEGLSTLKDYIGEITRVKLPEFNTISMNLSYQVNQNKKLFGAKLIPFIWNNTQALALVLNDLTDQESINALKLADEKKNLMIATVSHELRTPLNNIIGVLQMTESKVKDKEITDYLSLCKDNADLLLNLVNSILDIQQVKAGTMKLNPSIVNIRQLVNDVQRSFFFSASLKGIYIETQISLDAPVSIITDGDRLKQILINLIGNAMKFTLNGGITVRVYEEPQDDRYIRFIIADTGIGIKEENKDKLFKKYSKVDDPEGINKGGVGLGLMIADTLSKLLKGDEAAKGIQMESQYGVGTKFWFTILKSLHNEEIKSVETPYFEENKNANKSHLNKKEFKISTSLEAWQSFDIQSVEYDESIKPQDIDLRLANYSERKRINLSFLDSSLKISKNTSREILFGEDQARPLEIMGTASPLSRYGRIITPSYFSNSPNRAKSCDLNKGVILIVDDNAFNIFIAKNAVEGLGYLSEAAMNGEDAIEKVKALTKDNNDQLKIILMDCQMPVMDGFEATKELRRMMENNEINKVPIVALTAAANKEISLQECLDCGMKDLLTKPLVKEDLLKVFSKLNL